MNKKELRKLFLEKRQSLSEAEYLQLNYSLCENFFTYIDLSFIKVLHTFLPIEKNREPNTWTLIDRIRREFPNTRLSIPKINPEDGTLDNFFFEGLHQLVQNTWGIPEPKQGVPTPSEKIEMILVPMLTFDKQGHRVGYGKGFYDKLISETNPSCQYVGISLFPPVEAIEDIGPHDQSLTTVITPDEVFYFKR